MAIRFVGNEDGLTEIGAPHRYKVGDMVFARMGESGADGMFIGRMKAAPGVLVLIVGKSAIEALESECAPTGGGFPAEGASWRRTYQKAKPGALAPA